MVVILFNVIISVKKIALLGMDFLLQIFYLTHSAPKYYEQ